MKQIIQIAWKDIRLEFSERSTLIFFLILPLVFTTIIGLGLKNTYGDDELSDPRTALVVVNQDLGDYGAQLIRFMENSDTTRPVLRDKNEALDLIDQESIDAYVVIPQTFSDQLINNQPTKVIFYKNPQSNTSIGLNLDLSASITKLNTFVNLTRQDPLSEDETSQTNLTTLKAEVEERLLNPSVKAISTQAETAQINIATGFEQSSPGQLVTWVLTTLLGGSAAFVNERENGTLRRLLISPNRKGIIFSGKILATLSMGIVQMIILVGFGAIFLNVNWGRDYLALALILFTFGLAGTSLGIMLASFVRSVRQATNLTILFSMSMAALGGAWWPLEITPIGFQKAVQILPSTWAMRGFNDVIIRGLGVEDVLLEAGVLLGFSVLFFIIGIWRLRFE